MTTMADALKTAGVKLTANRRIFNYLMENPGRTCKQIEGVLKMECHQALFNLEQRKMISSVTERHMIKGFQRKVKVYRCAIREWEILPMPLSKKAVKVDCSTNPCTAAVPSPATPQLPSFAPPAKTSINWAPEVAETAREFVDKLTVKEAREVYQALKAVFS